MILTQMETKGRDLYPKRLYLTGTAVPSGDIKETIKSDAVVRKNQDSRQAIAYIHGAMPPLYKIEFKLRPSNYFPRYASLTGGSSKGQRLLNTEDLVGAFKQFAVDGAVCRLSFDEVYVLGIIQDVSVSRKFRPGEYDVSIEFQTLLNDNFWEPYASENLKRDPVTVKYRLEEEKKAGVNYFAQIVKPANVAKRHIQKAQTVVNDGFKLIDRAIAAANSYRGVADEANNFKDFKYGTLNRVDAIIDLFDDFVNTAIDGWPEEVDGKPGPANTLRALVIERMLEIAARIFALKSYAPAASRRSHIVRQDETMESIAFYYLGSISRAREIIDLNGLDSYEVTPGQRLWIP